jgi:hypothetical protein
MSNRGRRVLAPRRCPASSKTWDPDPDRHSRSSVGNRQVV